MASSANRRTGMTIFSAADDMYSHQVRMVLAEKGVTAEVLQVSRDNLPEEVYEVNPYGSLPTLIDRDFSLYQADILLNYLDERFPHPQLMPADPVQRAHDRWLGALLNDRERLDQVLSVERFDPPTPPGSPIGAEADWHG